jgi:hypothetical protein
MRESKRKHLRSANSEDAVTWNVFRSLRQIDPKDWLPSAWRHAFPSIAVPNDLAATVRLWESVRPPLGLVADGDEGTSEIDVLVESAAWVWFIEAKYRATSRSGRPRGPSAIKSCATLRSARITRASGPSTSPYSSGRASSHRSVSNASTATRLLARSHDFFPTARTN